jgi:hypothetical protein
LGDTLTGGGTLPFSYTADDGPLDNAAATCFVENIAGEPCDRELSPHLTGEAKRYWHAWGGRAEPSYGLSDLNKNNAVGPERR